MKLLVLLLILAAGMTAAQAHAFLDHSDPKVGSTIAEAPGHVTIWFTMDPNPDLTRMTISDASGKVIAGQDSKVDTANPSALTASLPKLPPGTYKVAWNAVCKFGHHTSGSFTFTVTGAK